VFLISCDSDSPSGPGISTDYEIHGTITDTNGNPLNDIDIYFIYNLQDINIPRQWLNGGDTTSYLNQNFPNPFYDGTNITYYVSQRAHVKIFITPFNSSDTLSTLIDAIKEEDFYTLFYTNTLSNNLYSLKLWLEDSTDAKVVDEIKILRNNDLPDSLTAEDVPNIELSGSTFTVKISSLPLNNEVAYTNSSPNVEMTKLITNELTFVLSKQGYQTLVVTYPINMNDNTELTFTMEAE
jgi:hypothetical protein